MMTFKQWLKHCEQNPQPVQSPEPTTRQTGSNTQLKLETYQKRKRPAG